MQGRREGLAYKTFASVTNFWQSRTSSASATLPMHQIQPQLAQTQQIAPTHEIQSEPLFLLLCIKSCQFEFATNLVQLRACDLDSDQACFAKLRDIYEQIRGKWIRKFSLRTLTSIKFVQVCASIFQPQNKLILLVRIIQRKLGGHSETR
jgi:hypothetical protein